MKLLSSLALAMGLFALTGIASAQQQQQPQSQQKPPPKPAPGAKPAPQATAPTRNLSSVPQ